MIKNCLFDLDGTLTDPRDGITGCIQHALRTLGVEPPDARDLEQYIGPPLGQSFQRLLGTSDPEVIRSALSAYRQRFAAEGLYENRVYPEIPQALETLRSTGRQIFLVTVKPRVFAERIVDHFDLAACLDGIYAPDLTEVIPVKGSLIALALSRELLRPSETCMIGDRADDVVAAHANGIRAVAVTWGYGSRAELESARPDFLVSSVSELLACLDI